METLFVHLPFVEIDVFAPVLIIIGFCVGIVSAFLGIGGAWLVTPALNILGFPMAWAIGTDIAHIGPKGLLATIFHSRRKNVDYALAFFMMIGTFAGIELGAQTVMFLEKVGKIEPILRWVYIVLLATISIVVFLDRGEKKLGWHHKLSSFFPKPYFDFRVSGIRCSIWLPIVVGIVSGFLAGFLGIGGGLLRLPMLIYCIGCPPLIAVGTDLFEVMLSGFYGGATYALKGRIDYLAASLMLVGAVLGTRIGVMAACQVGGRPIKIRFGLAVFGCLVSLVFKQLEFLLASKIAIFTTVFSLVISILWVYANNRLSTGGNIDRNGSFTKT